jgi:hypothetical protein
MCNRNSEKQKRRCREIYPGAGPLSGQAHQIRDKPDASGQAHQIRDKPDARDKPFQSGTNPRLGQARSSGYSNNEGSWDKPSRELQAKLDKMFETRGRKALANV